MKRNDWIGAFVTLVITGIGYFLSGPKVAAAFIIVGMLGVLIIHYAGKKESQSGESPKADLGVKDSFNPTNTNTATGGQVKLEQHFHGVPVPSPAIPPASVVPPKSKQDSSKWDVRFLSARPVNIAASQDDETGLVIFREVNHHTGLSGIVACFRNEAIYGQRSYNAENVTAHLVMKDSSGQEIGVGISRGCWLNTPNDMIDIDVSESQCVVLVLVDAKSNGRTGAFVPC